MKAQNITIDISKLNEEQLEQLATMLYTTNQSARTIKEVNDRHAFLAGWMSESVEANYCARFC